MIKTAGYNPLMSLRDYFVGHRGISKNEAARILARVVELGFDFKSRKQFYHRKQGKPPRQVVEEGLPTTPTAIDDVLDSLAADYLPGMPNFASPHFLGFPDAGNSIAGLSGAVLSDFLNVNMINSTFCSRVAAEMEISVINWFREIIGYDAAQPFSEYEEQDSIDNVGGMVLYGGTMSNYAAALLARERAFPGTKKTGVRFDTSKVKVVVPEGIKHYTVAASLAWCGLGSENMIEAPIRGYRYDQRALSRLFRAARENGERIIMLVAYAGDSRTMTIEDLTGLHDLVRGESPDTWLHCDGCHGTSLAFSEKLRHHLQGIELYDSVTVDPHKVLAVPYPLSLFLVARPEVLRVIDTESDLIMRQGRSLGRRTPVVGSKAFIACRLWMLMKMHGVSGIAELVEQRCDMAQTFAEMIRKDERFLLINDVMFNSVTFVYVPRKFRGDGMTLSQAEELSVLNRRIYEQVMAEGKYYIHSFVIADDLNRIGCGRDFSVNVLRFMSGNPLISEAVLVDFLGYLSVIADECSSGQRLP
ncbi:MAG: pyridoxal-dependent decarboxylase [Acidimicrobiaceae bacterium]|nr:pyridoxal-dependent decarboxylase [Acidimicrobiaceae bacterium]